MALTTDQWYEKLKSVVPGWAFNQYENRNKAVFRGIAATLRQAQLDYEAMIEETFILQASTDELELHADERSVTRITDETDPSLAFRVQNLKNRSNKAAIKAIVDGLLLNGEATILEDWEGGVFANRENFISRGEVSFWEIINAFFIVVDEQFINPFSFVSREHFADREDFVGTNVIPSYIYPVIIEAVNKAKAFGCLYRILERA